MHLERATNSMLALTALSIVSALASLPTSLENFTLETCKLTSVSYIRNVKILFAYIFFISLSFEAKSLWWSVSFARASDCKLSVLISWVRLSRLSSIERTLVLSSAIRSSCFVEAMSVFNLSMRSLFPSMSETTFSRSPSNISAASNLVSDNEMSDCSFD